MGIITTSWTILQCSIQLLQSKMCPTFTFLLLNIQVSPADSYIQWGAAPPQHWCTSLETQFSRGCERFPSAGSRAASARISETRLSCRDTRAFARCATASPVNLFNVHMRGMNDFQIIFHKTRCGTRQTYRCKLLKLSLDMKIVCERLAIYSSSFNFLLPLVIFKN